MSEGQVVELAVAAAPAGPLGALWTALDRLDARLLQLAEPDAAPGAEEGVRTRGTALTDGLTAERPFAGLAHEYELGPGDLDVLVIALAPTVDLRYARAYGAISDEDSLPQPTVDLVLDVLSGRRPEALGQRARLGTTSPLVRTGALRLLPDAGEPSWLAAHVQVDSQVVRLVHGDDDLDPELLAWCSLSDASPQAAPELAALPVSGGTAQAVARLAAAPQPDEPRCLHLSGPGCRDGGGREIASALARAWGRRMLLLDVPLLLDAPRLPDPGAEPAGLRHAATAGGVPAAAVVRRLLREARLFGRLPVLEDVDALAASPAWPQVLAAIQDSRGWCVFTSSGPLPPPGGAGLPLLELSLPEPDVPLRRRLWRQRLEAARVRTTDDDLDALAAGFRVTGGQIADAAVAAATELAWQPQAAAGPSSRSSGAEIREVAAARGNGGTVDRALLFAAARAQSRPGLAQLARQVPPRATWDDLVLPPDVVAQLRELCGRVTWRHRVLSEWGLGDQGPRGTGVSALFVGASGTGKTMAAEVVAGELGLDLYRVDLARVVSKYLGETEKNLDRIFAAARDANAVLLFDEADALFGKRSEVRDSHDRYANVEIAYLLQQMEAHDGVAVLTSNLPRNVDDAFVRRLSFTLHFPFPDEAARTRLWSASFPAALPVAADVDAAELARRFPVSGGTIRNAVLAAAYRAAGDDRPVELADVLHGIRREYQKLGKALDPEQLRTGT